MLHEVLGWDGPMTHRQLLAWDAFFEADWNTPSKDNYYVMAVAAEVRRVLHNKPKEVELDHFKLKFGIPKPVRPMTTEEKIAAMEASKASWKVVLGVGIPEPRTEIQVTK